MLLKYRARCCPPVLLRPCWEGSEIFRVRGPHSCSGSAPGAQLSGARGPTCNFSSVAFCCKLPHLLPVG